MACGSGSWRHAIWLVSVLLVASLSDTVHAQHVQDGASRESPEYRELIHKALDEYELGNWAEAKLYFADAHALYPNARTLRGLALVAYGLRDYVLATDLLQQSLASQVRPLSPQMRSDLSKLLRDSKHFEARLRIEVSPASARARVMVKVDNKAPQLDAAGATRLNPGPHEITVSATGYQLASRHVVLDAGEQSGLQLELVATNAAEKTVALRPAARVHDEAAPADVAKTAASTPAPTGTGSLAPWLVTGAGGAVAIAGGVLLALALRDIDQLQEPRMKTEWSSVKTTYERTPGLSGVGIAMLAVGVAGVAIGQTWYWLSDGAPAEASVFVSPVAAGIRLKL